MSPSQRTRLVIAFLLAPAIPVLVLSLAVLLAPQGPTWRWKDILVIFQIGVPVAAIPLLFFVFPLFLWLRRTGRLRVYWAALASGAALAAYPLLFGLWWILTFEPGPTGFSANGVTYLENGTWTSEGLVEMFVIEPILYGSLGTVCGVIGWLIAFGPHVAVGSKDERAG